MAPFCQAIVQTGQIFERRNGFLVAFEVGDARFLGANGDDNAIETLIDPVEFFVGDLGVVFDFDTHFEDGIDLGLQDIFWQALIGDGLGHLAAQRLPALEDGDSVSMQGQLPGSGKATNTRPEDGILFTGRRRDSRQRKSHRMPAQRADQDGIVYLLAGAGDHAGVGAGRAAYGSGERVVLPDKFQSFVQFALAK